MSSLIADGITVWNAIIIRAIVMIISVTFLPASTIVVVVVIVIVLIVSIQDPHGNGGGQDT